MDSTTFAAVVALLLVAANLGLIGLAYWRLFGEGDLAALKRRISKSHSRFVESPTPSFRDAVQFDCDAVSKRLRDDVQACYWRSSVKSAALRRRARRRCRCDRRGPATRRGGRSGAWR